MAIAPVLLAGIIEGAIGALVGAYTATRLTPAVAVNPSRKRRKLKARKKKARR